VSSCCNKKSNYDRLKIRAGLGCAADVLRYDNDSVPELMGEWLLSKRS
jgi:hypothetical protein